MILLGRGSPGRPKARLGSLLGLVGLAVSLSPGPVEASEGTPARLDLRVSGADGSPVASPYVAVVPEDASWRRPLHEAVLEDATEVSWEIPPGRYRIAVGAPKFVLDRQPVIELGPGEVSSRRISLAALEPVEGRLVDGEERPIAGATVSHSRQLIYGYPGALSPLGEAHLARNFEATSDEDGRFLLHLHAEAGTFLAVEAAGRAPRFFPNLRLPAATSTLSRVTLLPGASLAVRWSGGPGSAAPWDRLQLVPSDEVFPAGLDLGGVLAFWARPLAGGVQTWEAVPAGRYEIWLKAPPSGPHTVGPVRLREISLRRGASESVVVEIPSASAPERSAAQPGRPDPPLDLLLPAVPGAELETLRVVGPGGSDGERAPPWSTEAVSGGVLLRIEEGCREGARFLVATSSRVAVVGPLDSEVCGESLRTDLHPRADLTLALQAPSGMALDELAAGPVRIDLSSCPGPPALAARIEIPVPAFEGHRIRSPIPAGCLDVAVRVADLAPLVWNRLDVPPGEVLDLGTRRLQRGAALLVRVISPRDRLPLAGVQVGAATSEALEGLFAALSQGRAVDLPGGAAESAAVTDPHGWARLYGLPTGEELVPLLLAPDRRVPVATDPVVLSPREELVLDAVELPPPAALTVEVELSTDLEDRGVEAYQVHLGAADGDRTRPSVTRPVDADGRARFEEVLPGRYRLMGIVRFKTGRSFPAGSEEVELGPEMDATVTLPLADSLYGGRVTYQGEAVAGSVALTPAVHTVGARGITVRLDEDGRYQALLEGPGIYRAQVTDLRDRRFAQVTVPEVEFGSPDLPVDIELPGASLHGQVIDERGRPVAEARIDLNGRRSSAAGERAQNLHRFWRSDEAGRFAIEAVEPGPWTIVARHGDRESSPETLEVPEDARVDGIRLVLEEGAGLMGQVLDRLGNPVAGARLWISVQPVAAGEVLPPISATTDREGRFSVQGPYEGRPANVEVSTADGRSAAFRADLSQGLRLDLPPAGGPLEVSMPCGGEAGRTARDLVLVSERGAFLSLLRHGSAIRDAQGAACRVLWTVPSLPVGPWRLVAIVGAAQAAALEAGGGQLLPALADVISQPGEPQRVTLPGASSSTADPAGGRD